MLSRTMISLLILSVVLSTYLWSAQAAPTSDMRAEQIRLRTQISAPAKFDHPADDPLLNELDSALEKIRTVYMQALFSGTHSPEMDVRMRRMEIQLFDLLDALYKQQRMSDYMKYEAEVTRQMILYNMLKKLFGYSAEENEKIE